MMKSREYYLFFIKNKYEDTIPFASDDTSLYALTDSKKIKKDFIFFRNMNIFNMKKVDIDSGQVELFESEYSNYKLSYHQLSDNEKISIDIPITNKEFNLIQFHGANLIVKDIYDRTMLNPLVFKPDILEILNRLNYVNIYDNKKHLNLDKREYEEIMNTGSDYVTANYLNIFIKLFGNTLRDDISV